VGRHPFRWSRVRGWREMADAWPLAKTDCSTYWRRNGNRIADALEIERCL